MAPIGFGLSKPGSGIVLAGSALGTGGGWFRAAEFADFAAIADFNRDRYAITTVPLASIPTAFARSIRLSRAPSPAGSLSRTM